MEQIKGDYAYLRALNLVDYCGDIQKPSKSIDEKVYHQNFSPNNIRKLVFSPDGVLVFYHISTPSNPKQKFISLNPSILVRVQNNDNYVPIINVLSAERVCASVEEVIAVTTSNDGTVSLTNKELDFESLIKSYKGSSDSSDIVSKITSRYKRLYSFSIYNGNMASFMENIKTIKDSPTLLLSKQDFMSNSVVRVFNEEWYKYYGSNAKYYNLDRNDSPLNNHFKKVIEKIESDAKKAKVAKFTDSQVKELSPIFEDVLSKYKGIYDCINRLKHIEKNGVCSFIDTFDIDVYPVSLHKCSLIEKEIPKYNITLVEQQSNEASTIRDNIECLKSAYNNMYTKLAICFLDSLKSIASNSKLAMRLIVADLDRDIVIPITLNSHAEWLKDYDFEFSGKRVKDSTANMCMLLVKLFAIRDGEKSISQFLNKEYWMEVLTC